MQTTTRYRQPRSKSEGLPESGQPVCVSSMFGPCKDELGAMHRSEIIRFCRGCWAAFHAVCVPVLHLRDVPEVQIWGPGARDFSWWPGVVHVCASRELQTYEAHTWWLPNPDRAKRWRQLGSVWSLVVWVVVPLLRRQTETGNRCNNCSLHRVVTNNRWHNLMPDLLRHFLFGVITIEFK